MKKTQFAIALLLVSTVYLAGCSRRDEAAHERIDRLEERVSEMLSIQKAMLDADIRLADGILSLRNTNRPAQHQSR